MSLSNRIVRIILAVAMAGNIGLFNAGEVVAQMMPMPGDGAIPHYFGPEPNWAYSPPLRKFVDSLPGVGAANANNLGQYIPIANPDTISYPGSDYYELAIVEYREQMHSDMPAVIGSATDPLSSGGTKLRGYVQLNNGTDPATNQNTILPAPVHYMGPLIIARKDRPVRVKFLNLLPIGAGGDLFIPVDKTVMGAGMGPIPMRNPDGTVMLNPDGSIMMEMYTENRASIHLHGGNTPWISDGTPHQWFVPAGENTPYLKGVSAENVPDMPDPGPGAMTFYYTNQQSARLLFYHDHAYGITRLNVYAGEAAGYLITDPTEENLIDTGVLPDQGTPTGVYRYGIPLVIQDKTFVDANTIGITDPLWRWGSTPGMPNTGDLWMPHVYVPAQNAYDPSGMNPFGRWHYAAWFWPPAKDLVHGPIPNPYYDPMMAPWEPPMIPDFPHPSMAMEDFHDTSIVNGTAYPYMEVGRRAYRFRVLNAANSRFLNLQMYYADPANPTEVKMVPSVITPGFPPDWPVDGREGGVPDPALAGPQFIQIGTEGGFLTRPAVLPNQPVAWNRDMTTFNFGNVTSHTLLLGPAERADVIVDFSQVPDGSTIILYNDAPAAFPALDPRLDYYTGAPDMTSTGGTITPLAGYGPNTRTIMQFRVSGPADAPFNLAALETALPTAFAGSQKPLIIPQSYLPAPYTAPVDTVSYIGDNFLTFDTPLNGVGTVSIINGGRGYTSVPNVTINGGGGTGATAKASIANALDAVNVTGTITDITLLNGVTVIDLLAQGTGYTTPPNVTISGGGGTGAQAQASVAGGQVTAITVINPGSGYTTVPTVTLSGGGGTGATAQATIGSGGINYTTPPTVTITGGGGTGAQAIATVAGGSVSGITLTNVVAGINVTAGGAGYLSAPTVTITGDGTGATAIAQVSGGAVTGITVTNSGSGYTTAPTVILTGASGAGATATAVIVPSGTGYTTPPNIAITGGGGTGATAVAKVATGGSGYTTVPLVTITGGNGTGATAEATLGNGTISTLTLTNPGANYTSIPTVNFTGGGGTGAQAQALISSAVTGITITNSGNGYASVPTVAITGGGGAGATATATISGVVNRVSLNSGGNNYTSIPTVSFTGGGGAGAAATATINGRVTSFTVTNGGSGYIRRPTVTVTGGGGIGARGRANIAGGRVTSISITSRGNNYTSAPTVTITGGGGTGATATAAIAGSVRTITLTNGGTGYTTSPTITFAGGGGTGARATAQIAVGVNAITITNGGAGYTSIPTVTITGGGGTGARAQALISSAVTGLTLISGGIGYTSAPAVNFTGGGGAGAAATAAVTYSVTNVTLTNKGVGYTIVPNVTIDPPATGTSAVATASMTGTIDNVWLTKAGTNYTSAPTVSFTGGGGTGAIATASLATTVGMKPKAIQDEMGESYDKDYGRMSGKFGLELPRTQAGMQTFVLQSFQDPPTEYIKDGEVQIWKITHNGVDTHPVHFHLFDVQLINRVAWDNSVSLPDPNEMGWKDTVRVSPLEDTILALRPTSQNLPFNLPDSIRPLDPAMPLGSTVGFSNMDPYTGNPITVINELYNFGWEYMVHCHILGHEEMDMMRAIVFEGDSLPGEPNSVTAQPGNQQAIVSFNPPPALVGTSLPRNPVTSYRVTASPGGRTATGVSSPITITGLANGTTYTFTVAATNAIGTGPASEPSNAVTPGASASSVPAAPTSVIAMPGNNQVSVNFTAPILDGGSPITSFTVTSSPGGLTATGATSPLTVTGLTNGTAYTFTAAATNINGTGPSSVPSNSVTPGTVTLVPGAPTTVNAVAGNSTAIVSFTAPNDNGNAIASYTVTSNPGAITATGMMSPVTVHGLMNGMTYTFTVTATNAIGTGPASLASNSVTPASVPDAPTMVTATAGNGQATVDFMAPMSDGGSPITGYTVISSPGGLIATGAASPITVTGLTNGTTYTFIVKATNAIGTGPASIPSNSVTSAVVPDAPTIGMATAGNAQAIVGFTAPVSNGGSPITNYTVTSNPGGITATGTLSPIMVTGLINGTSYTFTVTATNAMGASLPSAASNSVTPATTPDAPTIGVATAGNTQATVSFTPPAIDGGSPIVLYVAISNPGNIIGQGSTSPVTVTGLTNGTPYTFTVKALNILGAGPASAASNSVTPAATVPGAPTGLTAVAGNTQATIGFSAPLLDGGSPITGYTVTSNPGGFSATGTTSPIIVTGLTNGTAYAFTATATNAIGTSLASVPSNSITPLATGAPGAPTGVAAATGNAQATITFTAPASDGGSPILFYAVTSSPGGLTATGPASPLTVTGLTNGTAYTFTVTATNINGVGAVSLPSNSVTPDILPGAPTIGTATAGDTQATVTFTAPAPNGGSPITSYTVTSSPGNLTATGAGSPLTVTGLTNATAYTFTAAATNGAGTGAASAASNSVTPSGIPIAPTTVTATPGNTQATITFSGENANGSPITSYTVTSSPGGLTATGAASPLIVTGLTNGTAYTFTVTATNASGTSLPSAASSLVTPATLPGAPTIGAATAGDTTASVTFTAPASDGGSPITGYTVTSAPGGITVAGLTSPLTVTGLTNGTAYTFTVAATNAIGVGPASTASNSVTPSGLPTAPTTVTATPGNTQATVTFSGENANGSPITSYTVTSTPGNLTATGATSPLTVTGLTNGTAYTFTVTATNALGTSAASVISNSVTPATLPDAPTIGAATAGDTTASVTFTAPASDGGSAITSYTVTSTPGNLTATGATSPLTVLGLTNGTAYTFTVTATNAIGTGPQSAASNNATPAGLPTAPTTVTATPGNAQATVAFSGADANGSPITSYTVISSPGSLTATGAASPLTVTGLTNGTAYTFTVTATNALGTSPASAASNPVTPALPPTAPQVGTVTPASGSSTANQAVNFNATYSDANGWQDLQIACFKLNTSTSGSNSATTYYDVATNLLYLKSDDGMTWLGGFAPGSANVIQNSQASLNCSTTTVSGAGTTLTINWNLTLKPAFAGAKNAYLYVRDAGSLANGWTQRGTWTIN